MINDLTNKGALLNGLGDIILISRKSTIMEHRAAEMTPNRRFRSAAAQNPISEL
jgi:hypothetical protein